MQLSSPSFEPDGPIPPLYTCDGDDISPALNIGGVPPGAASLVLIVDDPDAPEGTFTHWLLWNIPPQTRQISERTQPKGAVAGHNDFGKTSYGGPCPPSGTHRYFFKLFALDILLDLPAGATRSQLEAAMSPAIIATTELVGTYARRG